MSVVRDDDNGEEEGGSGDVGVEDDDIDNSDDFGRAVGAGNSRSR